MSYRNKGYLLTYLRLIISLLQMVKMMVTVVVIYALCWLPLHSVTLAGDTNPSAVWSYRHIQIVWVVSHWLAMSNCCYNPFVYFWMSSNFRSAFCRLARRALCRRQDDGAVAMAEQRQAAAGGGRSPGNIRAVRLVDLDDRGSARSPDLMSLTPRCTTRVRSSI